MLSEPPKNRSLALAESYLRGMQRRGELVPGGADRVLQGFQARAGGLGSPLKAVVEFLHGPAPMPGRDPVPGPGARYLNPEHEPAKEMPVRAVLARLAEGGHIKKDAVAPLVEALAAEVAGYDPGAVAERVVQRLERRENWLYLVEAPRRPASELKVLEALKAFRAEGHLNYRADLDSIAQAWGPSIGNHPEHEVARAVAKRLSMPFHADGLTRDGQPVHIPGSHEIFRARVLTAEERAASPLRSFI